MKQTAVEWLVANLPSLFVDDSGHYKELFEKAKAMEKEQIIEAYTIGSYDMAEKEFRPEQYYQETYGKTA